MPRCYISYIRVSTQRQGQSGLGLEAQQDAVRRHLKGSDGKHIGEYVEIESGKLATRPVLQEAIAECRHRKAILVIAKLDRLSRNVAFVSSLMESGIEFVAVDAPYANRLMIHILAAFAEHEREQISARTKAALAAAKARGVRLGAHGAILAAQQKIAAANFAETMLQPINDARCAGANTLSAVAEYLNTNGWKTREGGRWYAMTVARAVRHINRAEGNVGLERTVPVLCGLD